MVCLWCGSFSHICVYLFVMVISLYIFSASYFPPSGSPPPSLPSTLSLLTSPEKHETPVRCGHYFVCLVYLQEPLVLSGRSHAAITRGNTVTGDGLGLTATVRPSPPPPPHPGPCHHDTNPQAVSKRGGPIGALKESVMRHVYAHTHTVHVCLCVCVCDIDV